jgi:hypothetical protein
MYVMTIGVLAPYRGLGLGAATLESVRRFQRAHLTSIHAAHVVKVQVHRFDAQLVAAGRQLIERSIAAAQEDPNIKSAYLHVQSTNQVPFAGGICTLPSD